MPRRIATLLPALASLALAACGGGSSGAQDAGKCVGPTPMAAAFGALPSAAPLPDGGGASMPTLGQPPPAFTLTDFQPRSCGYRATYGLDLFRGRPLAVALWAGW